MPSSYTLGAHFEKLVKQLVKAGRYNNASEVVRDALRQMDDREQRLVELRAAIAIADQQIARGQVAEWTPELRAEILREGIEPAKAGKRPKADVLP